MCISWFLKIPLESHICLASVFSLSLPDDSLKINTAPPIIIWSCDTHSIIYQLWHGFQAWHIFTSTLWLSCRTSQAVWYFESTIKITFSRTVRVHSCCTRHKYRLTHVPEIALCILLWSTFEVGQSAFPEILNMSSEILSVGPPHLLGCYCSTDAGNLSCLFILSFC